MRLTKYEPSKNSMFPYKLRDEESSTELDATHKLGRLEDIEEELGIDLITLFNILRTGGHIWVKNRKGIHEWHVESLKQRGRDGQWYLTYSNNVRVRLRDYGKKWALTKEELE